MATEIITTTNTYDDVDMHANPSVKTVADVKVYFSYRDSGPMVLDLTDAHAKELDEIMAGWVDIATTVKATRATRTPRTASDGTSTASGIPGRDRTPAELKAFRKWAEDQGQPVHKYDGGGYKYDADQLAAWDAAREASKADESATDAK